MYITLVTEANEASSLGGRTPTLTGHGEMIDKPPSMLVERLCHFTDLLVRDPPNGAV